MEERVNVGVNFLLSAEVPPNPLQFRLVSFPGIGVFWAGFVGEHRTTAILRL